jgi:hypothetical protein
MYDLGTFMKTKKSKQMKDSRQQLPVGRKVGQELELRRNTAVGSILTELD